MFSPYNFNRVCGRLGSQENFSQLALLVSWQNQPPLIEMASIYATSYDLNLFLFWPIQRWKVYLPRQTHTSKI